MGHLKKSVAGIAVQDGKLFIARRKGGGALGGKWEFPGGKVEEGEDDAQALRREFQEEFGAVIETGEHTARAVFEHNGAVFDLNAYRIFFVDNEIGAMSLFEHSAWRWADIGEIEKLDFAGSDLALLPELKLYLGKQRGIDQ
jgi:8-oxo-dGTP diphosphatase